MGRPKTYDRSEVLRKATDLFWRKGYEGTHLGELVMATGINRFSLYKEFGGKEGLFQAALEDYLAGLAGLSAILEREPLGLANLRAFYETFLEQEFLHGCFALNTIREKHVVPRRVLRAHRGLRALLGRGLPAQPGRRPRPRRALAGYRRRRSGQVPDGLRHGALDLRDRLSRQAGQAAHHRRAGPHPALRAAGSSPGHPRTRGRASPLGPGREYPGLLVTPWLLALLALQGSTLDRAHDPVVLAGADLAGLLGAATDGVAAFRHGPGWTQVPVQIDERAVVSFQKVYGPAFSLGSNLTTLAYTDPTTYTGPDPDPLFDQDDELVVMAVDAGARAPAGASEPAGAIAGSGVELAISDPLDGGQGYVYLFRHDGTLDPAAGEDRVQYSFQLLSGNYLATYNTALGPNPELSVVTTPDYQLLFTDRWIRDALRITAGAATGTNILDRERFQIGPGQCARTEETFANGEGAFFANVDGPLRAIRSFMGANSAPINQRDHILYATREDAIGYLRLHEFPMLGMNFMDYEPGATGMVYRNDLNPGGVPIDGVPETLVAGSPSWELIRGPHGSLITCLDIETDIVPEPSGPGFYLDDFTPSEVPCTGDPFEFGSSGPSITSPLPNTDPLLGPANKLWLLRTHFHEPPGSTTATAALRYQQFENPLEVEATPFPGCSSGTPYCTAGTSASGCQASLCASGAASASAPSGFSLQATTVEGQKDGLFFFGTTGQQANSWGTGTSFQCVVPPVVRAGTLAGSGTLGLCDGSFSQDLNALWCPSCPKPQKNPGAAAVVRAQLWYRDPLSTSNQTTSLSDAIEFVVAP